ncbi:MAG: hypothetical protein ACK4HR_07460 [Hyphomonas sp.]|jgi:hypothetical protein
MKRFLPVILIAVVLVVAIVAVLWASRPREPATVAALPDYDYSVPGSWAVRPQTPPPAVWEGGWDMDVMLLSAGQAIASGAADTGEKRVMAATKSLRDMSEAFLPIGPVYAPLLRGTDVQADTAAAWAAYLADDNRGRAFIIVTDTALPQALVDTLSADPLLRDRFAGVLVFGETPESAGLPPDTDHKQVCSRRYENAGGCTQPAELRRSGGGYTLSGGDPPGGELVSGFIAWLHENASKLAEPLGDLEEVKIVDIQTAPEGQ